jgi:hypothetical protein
MIELIQFNTQTFREYLHRIEWCHINIGPGGFRRDIVNKLNPWVAYCQPRVHHNINSCVFRFYHEDDATLFKLRWML